MTSELTDSTEVPPQPLRSFPWQVRVILAVLFALAGATLWLTNTILTDRVYPIDAKQGRTASGTLWRQYPK